MMRRVESYYLAIHGRPSSPFITSVGANRVTHVVLLFLTIIMMSDLKEAITPPLLVLLPKVSFLKRSLASVP